MSNNAAFDASIPVLTEVFQDHPVPEAVKQPPGEPVTDFEPAARGIGEWSGPEWKQLERGLSERILNQLQGRLDVVLDQRLRDSVQEAVQAATAAVTDEIRRSLQQTIEQIVASAVAHEVAHLQTLRE